MKVQDREVSDVLILIGIVNADIIEKLYGAETFDQDLFGEHAWVFYDKNLVKALKIQKIYPDFAAGRSRRSIGDQQCPGRSPALRFREQYPGHQ